MATTQNTVIKPYVFVSYSSKDKSTNTQLIMELLHRYPKHVWIDEIHRQIGRESDAYIKKTIQEASAFCIFITKNALDSSYVQKELEWADEKKRKDPQFHLIPVMLEKVEYIGFKQNITFIDLTTPESCMRDMVKLMTLLDEITKTKTGKDVIIYIILAALIGLILLLFVCVYDTYFSEQNTALSNNTAP
ncbi:MAG: toll/interleukin-1 receptor domain-containing protein [Candidatus Bathyarchaeota archaeon]|nr:toll/interleukin-1 receptor domain-containing protein [Candidatus Termiticorpusculum sp.]